MWESADCKTGLRNVGGQIQHTIQILMHNDFSIGGYHPTLGTHRH